MDQATLLLAEDDPDIAYLVCNEFRKLAPDWEVCHAFNGRSAMRRLSQTPTPTVLITDLNMPLMDGFQLIEWARSEERLTALRILVYSSSDEVADQRRCENLQTDGYIRKAISLAELRDHLRAVIRSEKEPAVVPSN